MVVRQVDPRPLTNLTLQHLLLRTAPHRRRLAGLSGILLQRLQQQLPRVIVVAYNSVADERFGEAEGHGLEGVGGWRGLGGAGVVEGLQGGGEGGEELVGKVLWLVGWLAGG